jgi:hypothetical protein
MAVLDGPRKGSSEGIILGELEASLEGLVEGAAERRLAGMSVGLKVGSIEAGDEVVPNKFWLSSDEAIGLASSRRVTEVLKEGLFDGVIFGELEASFKGLIDCSTKGPVVGESVCCIVISAEAGDEPDSDGVTELAKSLGAPDGLTEGLLGDGNILGTIESSIEGSTEGRLVRVFVGWTVGSTE